MKSYLLSCGSHTSRHPDDVHMRMVPARFFQPQKALKCDQHKALQHLTQLSGLISSTWQVVMKVQLPCRVAVGESSKSS